MITYISACTYLCSNHKLEHLISIAIATNHSTKDMSTKIFALKVQSPEATTPPKDYILVLNEQFTPNEFVTDLHELSPAIPTANGSLGLILEGSYRMPPRQFLRYMMTTVAYTPEVEGGICVPKLFGRGNGIMVDYEEGVFCEYGQACESGCCDENWRKSFSQQHGKRKK